MKSLVLVLTLFLANQLKAQNHNQISVVIVSCKTGSLIIDGTIIGNIESDDATKHTLSFGEHYIQVKTATEKISQTINVDQNTKDIFKIGCVVQTKIEGIRLIDKEVELTGI